jgi:hypothetical protein
MEEKEIPSYDGIVIEPEHDPEALKAANALSDVERILENRERFGTKNSRTPAQWSNLILDFGYEKVCHFEDLTPAQLRKKIAPSFSQSLKEKFRKQNLERANG